MPPRSVLTRRAALLLGAAAAVHGGATLAAGANTSVLDTPAISGRFHADPRTRGAVAVLMLNGSDGGVPPALFADDLAASGFPTLALAYQQDQFGRPANVRSVAPFPLEVVFSGIDWLAARPAVDPARIVLMGLSRGAELALLVASLRPDIAGVIAFSPGSHVWGGVSTPRGTRFDVPMWSLGGSPVTYNTNRPDFSLGVREWFARAPNVPGAAIPVERIDGPILLISSQDDGIWPASQYADEIEFRLRDRRFSHPVRNLQFNDASHLLMGYGPAPTEFPIPGTSFVVRYGGTAAGTLTARNAGWSASKALLRTLQSRSAS